MLYYRITHINSWASLFMADLWQNLSTSLMPLMELGSRCGSGGVIEKTRDRELSRFLFEIWNVHVFSSSLKYKRWSNLKFSFYVTSWAIKLWSYWLNTQGGEYFRHILSISCRRRFIIDSQFVHQDAVTVAPPLCVVPSRCHGVARSDVSHTAVLVISLF